MKWITREFKANMVNEIDELAAFVDDCNVVHLDDRIAVAAALERLEYQLSAADSIIFATAKIHGATLITCDRHFEGLPGVTYIEKIK